jgi:hypothetical protein
MKATHGNLSQTLRMLGMGMIFGLLLTSSAFAQQDRGATLGGYGELHYNDPVYNNGNETAAGQLDFHRFILFAGYQFNDWISFHSELELEHTLLENEDGMVEGGEIALEQAYIDLKVKRSFGVRAGLMIVPVGIVNPTHEPPTFNGVERPNVEKYLIPSTWRESGIGVYGSTPNGLSYQAYVMAGLKPNKIEGDEGIREARQSALESSTANLALTGRLDYQLNLNLKVGASYYFSNLSSEIEDGNAEDISALDGVNFNLIEGHAIYRKNRFEARGLLVFSGISDVEALNTEFGHDAGKSQFGGYAELAYDLLPFFNETTEQQLFAFGRYEAYNTQFKTAQISADPANARTEYTFGFTYKPTAKVAFKADYQVLQNDADDHRGLLNLGVGYNF